MLNRAFGSASVTVPSTSDVSVPGIKTARSQHEPWVARQQTSISQIVRLRDNRGTQRFRHLPDRSVAGYFHQDAGRSIVVEHRARIVLVDLKPPLRRLQRIVGPLIQRP